MRVCMYTAKLVYSHVFCDMCVTISKQMLQKGEIIELRCMVCVVEW